MLTLLHKMGTFKRGILVIAAAALAFTALFTPQVAQAMPIPASYGRITVFTDPLIPAWGMTGPIYGPLGSQIVIRINPIKWIQMPEGTQQFTLDHELAHAVTNYPPGVSQNQREWDADTSATLAMVARRQDHLIDQHIMYLQQLMVSGFQLGPMYAPFPVMIAHIQTVKAQYRATHP
jgi:hypothetical protein